MPYIFRLIAVVSILISSGVSSAETLSSIIETSGVKSQDLSLWIAPISGTPIVTARAKEAREPASVMKMVTTSMALLELGPNYRWETKIYTAGKIKNGVLYGDLYIKGSGNPYLMKEDMNNIVANIQTKGITSIKGKIFLDGSYFKPIYEDPNAFDGKGFQAYNAIPSALSVNFRISEIKLTPSPAKHRVDITLIPNLTMTKVVNNMKLNNSKKCYKKGFSPIVHFNRPDNILTFTGQISIHCPTRMVSGIFADAGDLFYGNFVESWKAYGGQLKTTWDYKTVPKTAKLLYIAYSKPLEEQIIIMNQKSNNLMTRQLFLTIGAQKDGAPGTTDKSIKVVKDRLNSLGLNTKNLKIDNGCGLSRESSMDVEFVGKLLQKMARSNVSEDFKQSLAIYGKKGTLRHRLKGTPLEDNAIGKTGSLKDVHNVAGYVTTKSGHKYVFVIFIKGKSGVYKSIKLQNSILTWLYDNH